MFLRLPRTSSLSGTGQFDEDSLAMKQAELERLRAERMAVEAQIEYLKTGRSQAPPTVRPLPMPVAVDVPTVPDEQIEFFPGSLKVATLIGIGVAAMFVFRRKS